ncbi:tRNA 2-selenouridine(34) synthase MnmH [Undibacterium sp.]|uniref:tRNA 2-selenouridine(34) synthase MnmH n=1 Tax=Undibacterium sp. TaxID=1914977 RepID=UPI0025DAA136|nr:tRNA 2-selenouridine(34) synthase MnmH [Undibacterium sp.]
MKYPQLASFPELLAQLSEFDTIIDVRSPSEFAEDHIPGAINCPVLDDQERIRVGTMYKQVNAFEAKKVGAALVAKNIASHLEQHFLDKPREWKPLIYCWRGGNRSGSMAHILAKIGWPVVQLDGGYKNYRQHVNTSLPELAKQVQWRVVCGTTGSGKSRLLGALANIGAQVLDLEQLAEHRGSVLGYLPSQPQPTQKMFESRIWEVLSTFDFEQVVFVESESKKVGNLRVPDSIIEGMRASPCIALELALEERVALLMEDYAHFVSDPAALNLQLDCLLSLHGKERIESWKNLALQAQMPTLVAQLLELHYDPAYRRSIDKNFTEMPGAVKLFQSGIQDADFTATANAILN